MFENLYKLDIGPKAPRKYVIRKNKKGIFDIIMVELTSSLNSKIKLIINNKVLDEFFADMKQKYIYNNTMSRMDQLQSQIDALFKAIGG